MIAESEETAVIFGMPQQAIRTGAVDAVLRSHEIAPVIQAGLARSRERADAEECGMSQNDDDLQRTAERVPRDVPQGRGVHQASSCARTSACAASSLAVEHAPERRGAGADSEWDKLREELVERIQSLEEEKQDVLERLRAVEEENRQFAERYLEVEEENNNLANLYVSSFQLHSTLDLAEVLKIMVEIVINLVGAECSARLRARRAHERAPAGGGGGRERSSFGVRAARRGLVGTAVAQGEIVCSRERRGVRASTIRWSASRSASSDSPIGAIAMFGLLAAEGAASRRSTTSCSRCSAGTRRRRSSRRSSTASPNASSTPSRDSSTS